MSSRCALCHQSFDSNESLQQHKRESPAHTFDCRTCDRHYGSETALQQHLRDSPAHVPSFDCEDCNQSFSNEEALRQHLRNSTAHAFDCDDCDRAFDSEEALQQHLRDSPAHAPSFDCDDCVRAFDSEEARGLGTVLSGVGIVDFKVLETCVRLVTVKATDAPSFQHPKAFRAIITTTFDPNSPAFLRINHPAIVSNRPQDFSHLQRSMIAMQSQIKDPVEFALQQARVLPEQPRKELCKLSTFKNFEEQASALESLPKDEAFQDAITFFGLMCAACTNARGGNQSHHGQPQHEQDNRDIGIVVKSWLTVSLVRLSLSQYARTELSRSEVSSTLDAIIEDFESLEDQWRNKSLDTEPHIDTNLHFLRRALSAAKDCRDTSNSYQRTQHMREQTENALLHKYLLLHTSSKRDAGAAQPWTLDRAFGKRILEASRVKDEASLKVELLDEWAQLVLFSLEVPKENVRSLASLLASFTDIEKVAEQTVPSLKELSSLPPCELAEMTAAYCMLQAGNDLGQKILDTSRRHSCWDCLPDELFLAIFSFLNVSDLKIVRLVSRKWSGSASDLVSLKFPYHGCEQNAAEFLLLTPFRLPLEISSYWYPLKLRKDQLDTKLAPLGQLKSISLVLKAGSSRCRGCGAYPDLDPDLDHLESTPFWRICDLIKRKEIHLKSLTFPQSALLTPSANILAKLGEHFPAQYRCLEELTLRVISENGSTGNFHQFIQSCLGLKKLRAELVSLWFLSDISWKDLSYLQLRIRRISREDLRDFTAFLRRHTELKRIVLCVKRLQNVQVEDNQQEGGEQEQLIKEILATVRDIDHDVRIVDEFDLEWAEQ